MAQSSSTSDTRPQQTYLVLAQRDWRCGHSYYVTPGVPTVQFACRKCDKELESHKAYHCWDCLSKYCMECKFWHDYETNGCPMDAPKTPHTHTSGLEPG